MTPLLKGVLLGAVLAVVLGVASALVFVKATGLTARATPGPMETAVARRVRALAVPSDYARRENPVPRTDEAVRDGMAHFADHCAICHANDGSGDIEMGKAMFPPAPDMRKAATQDLSDGALFYVIEHGIRFTGMPAWGTGTAVGEESSWHLVHFIRHLPRLTAAEIEEMEAMNPRPPAEIRLEIEEERFLRGEAPAPASPPAHAH